MIDDLRNLFALHFGEKPVALSPLRAHGSNRKLYRIKSDNRSVIGVENQDRAENLAFLTMSRHFLSIGLPVPEIYAEDSEQNIYLEEDLGDTTLFECLTESRKTNRDFPVEIAALYSNVVRLLPRFQIEADQTLNYEICYPRNRFDRQSMQWDLNYFKYYFLKLAEIPFDEQKLENDFETLIDFLLQAEQNHFLYRDFQSRNIMIRDGEPFFIDYQGGRKGALQYDIASLLYDAKADLPFELRARLLETYLEELKRFAPIEREPFLKYYPGYILMRIMQAMGAYGFRGFYQRKVHFLQSVPFALRNLEHLLKNFNLAVTIPHLTEVLKTLVRSTKLRQLGDNPLTLTVSITSFSYKQGLPPDDSGHGGGFIFDCRALPNPGRLTAFKELTGKDSAVVSYLNERDEVHRFLHKIQELLSQVVENYSQRNFTHLTVAFGCTGGQHRSVFCANHTADFLKEKYKLKVDLTHREIT